eukprot:5331925-Pyramimonas_sp.AAC.1
MRVYSPQSPLPSTSLAPASVVPPPILYRSPVVIALEALLANSQDGEDNRDPSLKSYTPVASSSEGSESQGAQAQPDPHKSFRISLDGREDFVHVVRSHAP